MALTLDALVCSRQRKLIMQHWRAGRSEQQHLCRRRESGGFDRHLVFTQRHSGKLKDSVSVGVAGPLVSRVGGFQGSAGPLMGWCCGSCTTPRTSPRIVAEQGSATAANSHRSRIRRCGRKFFCSFKQVLRFDSQSSSHRRIQARGTKVLLRNQCVSGRRGELRKRRAALGCGVLGRRRDDAQRSRGDLF